MKEKLFKKGITRRLFSVIIAITTVFAFLPTVPALAADYSSGLIWYNSEGQSNTNKWVTAVETILEEGDTLSNTLKWWPDNPDTEKCYVNGELLTWSGAAVEIGVATTIIKIDNSFDKQAIYLCSAHTGSLGTLCDNCNPNKSQPKPQPKTGVEDVLPVWFGVMAVSAAAYVLTSKKRFF